MSSTNSVCEGDSVQACDEILLDSPFKEVPLYKDVEISDPFPKSKRVKLDFQLSSKPESIHSECAESVSDSSSSDGSSDQSSVSSDMRDESSTESRSSNTESVKRESSDETSDTDSVDANESTFNLKDPFTEYDVMNDTDNIFEDTSEKLYSTSNLTVNQALAMLFTWFTMFPGISKEAFGRLLYLLSNYLLPQPNTLPSSYQMAHSLIQNSLVPVEVYDCCVNDCVLFRVCSSGDYRSMSVCPVCGEDRYKPYTKIPRKRFKYIPLAPRLHRLFRNEQTSKLIQSHVTSESTVVADLHQTTFWKQNYSKVGVFKGDPRGLSLALCTDGMNPFAKEKVTYSMWPINVCLLNLPHHFRITAGSMLLVGIIPGRDEAKTLDPYLEVLVDEVNNINGNEVYDGYRCEKFHLKASIVLYVLDYPGQNKVFHCHGAGAYAGCVYCEHQGEYSHFLQKMVYPGSRKFLPSTSFHRRNVKDFPSKLAERDPPPKCKTMDFIEKANKDYTSATTALDKKKIAKATGCKGSYVFQHLNGHDRVQDAPVDPMHLIKNIVEHTVKLLIGAEDSLKVRQQEQDLRRFPSAWLKNGDTSLPNAPFTLTKEEVSLANERLKQVCVPSGFDWNNQPFFSKPSVMKSHQWKQVAIHGVLKYCLRGMLGNNQYSTLVQLYDVLAMLCAEEVDTTTIDDLELKVHEALVLVERDFPLSLQVIVFHLLHHLPNCIRRFGPVYNFWMYPYERFNSWVTGRVLSRRFPESGVIETYRLSEWAHFMEASGQLPDGTALIRWDGQLQETNHASQKSSSNDTFELTLEQLAQIKIVYSTVNNDSCFGKEISSTVRRLRSRHYIAKNGRRITVNSADVDNENSYTSNSYVSSIVDGKITIGRTLSLFEHTVPNTGTTIFAYVSWFDGPFVDKKSNLSYVFCNSPLQSVVLFSSLSTPYVTAFDDQEPGKLWVLNL